MVYEHFCVPCNRTFDVIRPVSRYDDAEICAKCGSVAERVPFPRRVFLHGTAVQEKQFNHALGTVCTDNEAKQIAKERGLIEVGNERVEKHVKPYESDYSDIWKGA